MYLVTIEGDEEIQTRVRLLADAYEWLCGRYQQFPCFFESHGQFTYWYGRRKTVGVASFVKAARLCDDDGREVFRFRIYRLEG